eukprot:EG_transcript_3722
MATSAGGGQLWVAGRNDYGQLGLGHTEAQSAFRPVPSPAGRWVVTHVAAGGYHVVLATGSGQLYGFGMNNYGQLGTGGTDAQHSPQTVVSTWGGDAVQLMAAGAYHSLLVTAAGRLYGAGSTSRGQLGAQPSGHPATFQPIRGPWGEEDVAAIAAGYEHSLVVAAGGGLFAMGHNGNGQLGLGRTGDEHAPQRVAGPWGGRAVAAVAAGYMYSLVRTADGQLYSMGANDRGQLGLGHTTDQHSPQHVRGPWGDQPVTHMAAGISTTAVVAAGRFLYVVGYNDHGQLGLGHTDTQSQFQRVSGPWEAEAIAAVEVGWNHVLLLSAVGRVYVAGNGGYGQLGLGRSSQHFVLLPNDAVPTGGAICAVGVGDSFSVLITGDPTQVASTNQGSKGAAVAQTAGAGPVLEWDTATVATWLAGIGLAQFAPRFAADGVDGICLLALNNEDLVELGLGVGHRKRLAAELQRLDATPGPAGRRRSGTAPAAKPLLDDVLGSVAAVDLTHVPSLVPSGRQRARRAGRGASSGADRMEDGIAEAVAPVSTDSSHVAFYPSAYQPPMTAMEFVDALPPDRYPKALVQGMLRDFRIEMGAKVAVLEEQRVALRGLDVFAIFVYSYELTLPGDPPVSHEYQIYREMNRAMRNQTPAELDFWRPFIFHLDQALARLGQHEELVYRGVVVSFPPELYLEGKRVVWPAFSSASTEQAVAKDFIRGKQEESAPGSAGTLFVLKTSLARRVHVYSHFPEEQEVLFPPNSVFHVYSHFPEEQEVLFPPNSVFHVVSRLTSETKELLGLSS